MLKSRFGSSHLVAQRVINDLRNGKTVSSAAEVRKLADDLTTAYNGVAMIFFWGGPIFRDLRRPTRFGGGGG